VTTVLHVIGVAFALTTMMPGTPAASLPERIAYLGARPYGWTAGWLAWMACALSLLAFMVALARTFPSALTRAAAGITVAGALVDLTCDATFAWVLPARAAGDVARFVVFERHLMFASLTVANGLYTIGIALATLGLPRGWRVVKGLGTLSVIGGIVLAVAGVGGGPAFAAVGTALSVGAYVAWVFAASSAPPGR
jgi:hypothetical protein